MPSYNSRSSASASKSPQDFDSQRSFRIRKSNIVYNEDKMEKDALRSAAAEAARLYPPKNLKRRRTSDDDSVEYETAAKKPVYHAPSGERKSTRIKLVNSGVSRDPPHRFQDENSEDGKRGTVKVLPSSGSDTSISLDRVARAKNARRQQQQQDHRRSSRTQKDHRSRGDDDDDDEASFEVDESSVEDDPLSPDGYEERDGGGGLDDFIEEDDEDESPKRKRHPRRTNGNARSRSSNRPRRRIQPDDDDDIDIEDDFEGLDEEIAELRDEPAEEEEERSYSLRERKPVNYQIAPPPPLHAPRSPKSKRRRDGRKFSIGGIMNRGVGGMPGMGGFPGGMNDVDSSDDDFTSPRKPQAFTGSSAQGLLGGAGMMDLNASTGKLGEKKFADTDPLGVDESVNFDSVGGLDEHIRSLKEMVSLPLLYPEVFKQFHITPPRGVLFHGPPGTGKTLLARALAASCSTEGQKISFFMRKGADCLSKWVGEAERQLRLLFDEAKACQPSIIFFDEIDGLAPVRSSKQEQIHASIVSTLLALMDGMDNRGQIIVIGATNRPDAIDPALRRPGRFDREFYFGLPNREARRSIINIHTKDWEPPLDDTFKDKLAELTKGYGGADLRALCTEAALNAIQRRYPQIYLSKDKLLIDPTTIQIQARDFMVSVKKLIPSSQRATSSAAAPLPKHFEPLLGKVLTDIKGLLTRVIPDNKRLSVLEEAQYEDDGDGGFEREMLLQSFETMRVFKPRLLISGTEGLGQRYLGPAILHHLEGYHVQAFDLASLMSDSTRTPEAALIQLFVEAKRHKPSIIFIPHLETWWHTVSDSLKSTFKMLLDDILPSDPILFLAIANDDVVDDFYSLGFHADNCVLLRTPESHQRAEFFQEIVQHVRRAPKDFPDAMPRKKRVLEELPKAPPPPPREMTKEELHQLKEGDDRQREYLKWRLGPILNELKKRYKRFLKPLIDDTALFYIQQQAVKDAEVAAAAAAAAAAEAPPLVNGVNGEAHANGEGQEQTQAQAQEIAPKIPQTYEVDLERMHESLYYDQYLTPGQFIDDVKKIVHNAEVDGDHEKLIKAHQMLNHVKIMIDQSMDAQFQLDCERMAIRERERYMQRKAAEKAEKAKSIGVRHSARHSGEEPDITDIPDIAEIERRLRRERKTNSASGSDAAPSPNAGVVVAGPEAEAGMAQNNGMNGNVVDIEMDESAHSGQAVEPVDPVSQVQTLEASQAEHLMRSIPEAPSSPPEALSTMDNSHIASTSASVASLIDPVVAPFVPEPIVQGQEISAPAAIAEAVPEVDPVPEHLPLELDEVLVQQLHSQLTTSTQGCSVDQLEHLRAKCFETVWRERSNWDRNAVIAQLKDMIAMFVGTLAR